MAKMPSEKQQKLNKLRTLYRRLKKEPEKLRTLLRVKALIAYYKGHAPLVVADCYDVSPRTLRSWIKAFEADESLVPKERRLAQWPSAEATQ